LQQCGDTQQVCGIQDRVQQTSIRFTQLVLLQSFEDKFKCKASKVMVSAERGGVLIKKSNQEKALIEGEQTHYRSGVGKLLHMMR